jgi:hypothetical protein
MRCQTILFVLMILAACTPHPTHPTKVECGLEVETRFSARLDTTPPGTIRESQDTCNQGGIAGFSAWTQRGAITVPICVAAGTTPEQATSLCSRHFEVTGRGVGTGAPPLAARPPFGLGRICPGSIIVVSSQIAGTGGIPSLHPEHCREGTEWPLVP